MRVVISSIEKVGPVQFDKKTGVITPCTKAEATHLLIQTNIVQELLVDINCENFCLLEDWLI
jgi:hypothetical protein